MKVTEKKRKALVANDIKINILGGVAWTEMFN